MKKAVQFSPGDCIENRYLVEEIRRGRLGIVYLCRDTTGSRPVAVKTFDDQYLNSEENRCNFLEEASIWIQLDRHPNIVSAYALREVFEKPHLWLERVMPNNLRGPTLKDYLYTHPIDQRDMLQLGISICDGMIHALSKFPELVHRDLKPENILIGCDLTCKISDFGMSLRQKPGNQIQPEMWGDQQNSPSILARKMLGTPATASPEQCLGNRLDSRSDIYSFGCVLYQIATKRLPFYRASVEDYILAHLFENPVPPSMIDKELHPFLTELILKCLGKKAEQRFQSFSELRTNLIDLYLDLYHQEPLSITRELSLTSEEFLDRAASFSVLKDYARAREELRKAFLIDPGSPGVPLELGKLCLQQQRYQEAATHFENALSDRPQSRELLYWLGEAYRRLDRSAEAIETYRQGIGFHPENPESYLGLSWVLVQEKRQREAERTLREGLTRCPEKRELRSRLIELYRTTGDGRNESKVLEQSLTDSENPGLALLRLAEIARTFHDKRKTQQWLEKAVEENPDTFSEWYRIGTLFLWLNESNQAVQAWERAVEFDEGNASFYAEFAALHQRLRRYQEAWKQITRAEECGGDVEKMKKEIEAKLFKPNF